eukprot:1035803-Prorocentrum_lima.AAC.1
MTSSLVGSEMCIRDRTKSDYASAHMRCGESGSHRSTSRANMVGQSAVSYTHLTLPTICSV